MRALKTVLIILIALGALVLILGLVGPKSYRVERTVEIQATPDVVYAHVSHLGKMKEWSPWQELDKDQVQSIEGSDGTVGAIWKWQGDTVGSGMQEITELLENEHVRSKLTFFAALLGDSFSTSTYDLEPSALGTRITWGVEGVNDFRERAMAVFMDLEARLGPALERGLSKLSDMAEREQQRIHTEREESTFNGLLVDIVERDQQVYVGQREQVPYASISEFQREALNETTAALRESKVPKNGDACRMYFGRNDRKELADLLVAFPVKADTSLSFGNMQVYVRPASTMAEVEFQGDHSNLSSAHEALSAMMKAREYTEHGVRIEEYLIDQSTEPDTTKWLTKVSAMVR